MSNQNKKESNINKINKQILLFRAMIYVPLIIIVADMLYFKEEILSTKSNVLIKAIPGILLCIVGYTIVLLIAVVFIRKLKAHKRLFDIVEAQLAGYGYGKLSDEELLELYELSKHKRKDLCERAIEELKQREMMEENDDGLKVLDMCIDLVTKNEVTLSNRFIRIRQTMPIIIPRVYRIKDIVSINLRSRTVMRAGTYNVILRLRKGNLVTIHKLATSKIVEWEKIKANIKK